MPGNVVPTQETWIQVKHLTHKMGQRKESKIKTTKPRKTGKLKMLRNQNFNKFITAYTGQNGKNLNRQDISKIVEDTKETLSFLKLGRLMKDNDLKDLSERYQEEKSNTKKANIKREYLEATADDYIEEIDGNRRQQLMKRFLQIPKVSRQKIMEIISRMRTTPKRKKSQLETRVDKSVELFRSIVASNEKPPKDQPQEEKHQIEPRKRQQTISL